MHCRTWCLFNALLLLLTRFRNTYKHRLCTEILESGHHRSFAELFGLIRRQQMKRDRAGPESSLWHQKLLTDEPEKLDTMKNKLIEAETALLKSNLLLYVI